MSGKQFTIRRVFAASQAAVWRAWTDVGVAARWWHPNGMETRPESVTIDLREGGSFAYTMVDVDGGEYPWAGTYYDVQPIDHLRFTWGRAGSAETLVISLDLAEMGNGQTTMTFHVDGVSGQPGDDEVYDGWDQAFDLLTHELARKEPSR